jgi:hypothetical protein
MTVFAEARNAGGSHKKEREKSGIEQSPVPFHSDDYVVRWLKEQCHQSWAKAVWAEGVEQQVFGYRSFGKT